MSPRRVPAPGPGSAPPGRPTNRPAVLAFALPPLAGSALVAGGLLSGSAGRVGAGMAVAGLGVALLLAAVAHLLARPGPPLRSVARDLAREIWERDARRREDR